MGSDRYPPNQAQENLPDGALHPDGEMVSLDRFEDEAKTDISFSTSRELHFGHWGPFSELLRETSSSNTLSHFLHMYS